MIIPTIEYMAAKEYKLVSLKEYKDRFIKDLSEIPLEKLLKDEDTFVYYVKSLGTCGNTQDMNRILSRFDMFFYKQDKNSYIRYKDKIIKYDDRCNNDSYYWKYRHEDICSMVYSITGLIKRIERRIVFLDDKELDGLVKDIMCFETPLYLEFSERISISIHYIKGNYLMTRMRGNCITDHNLIHCYNLGKVIEKNTIESNIKNILKGMIDKSHACVIPDSIDNYNSRDENSDEDSSFN